MEDRIKKLELKITELENKLKEMGAAQAPAIDPEDMKTYQKVSNQLKACSIACAICQPKICWPCIPHCICPCGPGFCQPCVCTCGPCIASGSSGGGFSGFME